MGLKKRSSETLYFELQDILAFCYVLQFIVQCLQHDLISIEHDEPSSEGSQDVHEHIRMLLYHTPLFYLFFVCFIIKKFAKVY